MDISKISVSGIEYNVKDEYARNNMGVKEEAVVGIVDDYVAQNKEQLKGDKGDKGDQGIQGVQGEKGDKGDKGDTGANGKDGVDGMDGADGADGKSAYDIAVDNGFEGTEAEWLESLKGKDGASGGSASFESKWKDKKLGAFGTSITYLCGNDSGYLQTMKDVLGLASFANYGLSGHAITYVEGRSGISRKIQSTDISPYDVITIEGCTNDFKLNVPLGSVGKIGDTNFDDSADFCQALRKAIEYIFTQKPTSNIVLIADMQRDNGGYDVNHVNTAGYKLIDYVNAMIQIGALYGIPVCDLYRNSGFNYLTLGTYTTDGLHPNDIGFARIGDLISSTLNNMYSSTVIIGGGSEDDDSGENGGEDDGGGGDNEGENGGNGGGIDTPNENVATIGGVDYDISVASGYAYKMIMLLSEKYYLHYSNSPFYIYNTSGNAEVFQTDTYRSTNEGQTFPDGQLLSSNNYGEEIANGNGYKRSTRNRSLNNYVWTNADIKYWGTENVAVVSSV